MGAKGEHTRQFIRSKAYALFAEKGFKEITMKDICEKTGLSRGGLYRHYESTEQIFKEILCEFLTKQHHEFQSSIRANIPASIILDEVLNKYEREMLDSENSLSIAICEFFSAPKTAKKENFVSGQYAASKQMWVNLIRYGINSGEFNPVDPESVFDLIIFSYQGVRLYSRMMELDKNTPQRITEQIRSILLAK